MLLTIAQHYDNEKRTCHPSLRMIAFESRISKMQAVRAVKTLCLSGELAILRGGGGAGRGDLNSYGMPKFDLWFTEDMHRRGGTLPRLERVTGCDPKEERRVTNCDPKVKLKGNKNGPEGSHFGAENQNVSLYKQERMKEGGGANTAPPARPPDSKAKSKTAYPEGLALTFEMQEFASQRGVRNPAEEFAAFEDYHRSKGERHADWVATWRTWVRKAERFAGQRAGAGSGAGSTWSPPGGSHGREAAVGRARNAVNSGEAIERNAKRSYVLEV